jgi:hypothetical protein
MRFHPRHYILIAVIIALGIWNFFRVHRARERASAPAVVAIPAGTIPQSPAWQAFDHAAALRDAPEAQFQPALQAFQQQLDAVPATDSKADLGGCHTWLMFYRQSALHASPKDSWRQRSTTHLDTCVKFHRDISG